MSPSPPGRGIGSMGERRERASSPSLSCPFQLSRPSLARGPARIRGAAHPLAGAGHLSPRAERTAMGTRTGSFPPEQPRQERTPRLPGAAAWHGGRRGQHGAAACPASPRPGPSEGRAAPHVVTPCCRRLPRLKGPPARPRRIHRPTRRGEEQEAAAAPRRRKCRAGAVPPSRTASRIASAAARTAPRTLPILPVPPFAPPTLLLVPPLAPHRHGPCRPSHRPHRRSYRPSHRPHCCSYRPSHRPQSRSYRPSHRPQSRSYRPLHRRHRCLYRYLVSPLVPPSHRLSHRSSRRPSYLPHRPSYFPHLPSHRPAQPPPPLTPPRER
ncbi:uncharacterized protein LOC130250864 [Oenanthe melanoleuca]|uniref:uncharacterized protein LOC130250864 n=1 Tax=Oenanthe melanoleuca TaxID=2939378 RepID=UPI0024C0F1D4|nr:uncharacterized protein LOC130250864 [Oenanthe melanoleuca]